MVIFNAFCYSTAAVRQPPTKRSSEITGGTPLDSGTDPLTADEWQRQTFCGAATASMHDPLKAKER
jgi:hypothetical protein